MFDDIKVVDGFIEYYDSDVEIVLKKEVKAIHVTIKEDIHDVEGVSRITSLNVEVDDAGDDILNTVSRNLYNAYCDEEFFGEPDEQKIVAKSFLHRITGVPKADIHVNENIDDFEYDW